jgi:radical SAM superfamily enzyme YgiQ (UPF0313 family)
VVPRFVNKGEYYNFPVGIGYISSYLKSKGVNVFCLNLCHFDRAVPTEDILREQIEKHQIDILCTGTMSWYWDKVDEILNLSKKIKPEITTIVGNAIVISDPQLAMENLPIDIAVLGEGELTMADLAEVLSVGGDLEQVKGICFFRDGSLTTTPPRPVIENLDSLPFPDYEGLGFKEWSETASKSGGMDILAGQGKTVYAEIIGSRSCPFSCTFCYHHLGQRYRQRSLDNIFKEIEFLIDRYRINSLYFLDELFSANHQRMRQFAEKIKDYKIQGWGGSLRVNDVNLEIMKLLKESGLKLVSYGIENINDEILVSMNKRITKAEIENALTLTREAGIFCNGNVIFGDPAETETTIRNTLNWLSKNPQFNMASVFLKVIPDSPIYRYALDHGLIKDKLRHIREKFPILNLTKMSDSKFYALVRKINWIEYTAKFYRYGTVVETTKVEKAKTGEIAYSVRTKCPFCNGMSQSEKKINSSLWMSFVCDQCKSQYKIRNKDIFLDDYDGQKANLNHLKMFILNHFNGFAFFRNNRSNIIRSLSKMKRVLKPA